MANFDYDISTMTSDNKQKATDIFKNEKIDRCLSDLFVRTKTYFSNLKTKEFPEESVDIGLTNTSEEEYNDENGVAHTLYVADFDGTRYKIGGISNDTWDGIRYHIILFIDERLVINASYSYSIEKWGYLSHELKEFHYSQKLLKFLQKTEHTIDSFDKARASKKIDTVDRKFTFED